METIVKEFNDLKLAIKQLQGLIKVLELAVEISQKKVEAV